MAQLPDIVRGFQGRDAIVRMLAFAIRSYDVAVHATARLRPEDFNSSTESDFQVIWIVAKSYWDAYSGPPTKQYMCDICSSVLKEQGFLEGAAHARVHTVLDEIYKTDPISWDNNYGMSLLKAFLSKKLTDTVQHVVATNPGDAERVMELIQTEFHQRTIDDIREVNPLTLDANSLVSAPRRPLHVPQLDLLLGGGLTDSECVGILGPSGGGKTLLALQIGTALAVHREHCLYFTYEQPAEELRPRILSCLMKMPTSRFQEKRTEDLDDEVKAQVKHLAQYSEYLTVVDRSTGGDNTLEIDTRIRRAIEAGRKPRVVVIDWIWILVTRMAAASGKKNTQERQHLMTAMDAFKSMASKYRVSFLILQQLSTDQAKKSPSRKPQWFNAAEAGNFAWLLAYCFAIGQADGNGYCWLVGSKARNAKRQDVVQRLRGELNRFDLVDKDMTYKADKHGFIDSDKVDSFSEDEGNAHTDPTRQKYESAKDTM